ncbi:MAG: IS66 family transposase [Planctomycetota bacterium]|jgi:transposase
MAGSGQSDSSAVLDLDQEKDPEILRQAAKLAMQDNERLVARIVQLTEELSQLRGSPKQQDLQLEIDRLQEQLVGLRGELYGRKSERRGRGKKKGKTAPRRGHGPKAQVELVRVETTHELDEADQMCPKCGGEVQEWRGQDETSEEVDVIERTFVIRVHRKKKYRCCSCRNHVETAPGPPKLIPGGRYSTDFAIEVAIAKYCDHLPLERQTRMMRREGLRVDSQTLWDQLWAMTQQLRGVYGSLVDYVLSAPVICADETHWKMLGKGQRKRWQLWGVSCALGVFYSIVDSRSADAFEKIIGTYEGTVVSDGYSAYGKVVKARNAAEQLALDGDSRAPARAGPLTLAGCWVHARRPFAKQRKKYPKDCREILDLIGQLYDVERQAPFEPAEGDALERQLGLRLELRSKVSSDIVAAIMSWAETNALKYLPNSQMGKGINYLLNQRRRLEVFLSNPLVPLDNNQMERGLRGPVVGRKNFYGTKTERGADAAAVLYSLIESCKLAGAEPKAYLRYALRAAVAHRDTSAAPPELPHQWAARKRAEALPGGDAPRD